MVRNSPNDAIIEEIPLLSNAEMRLPANLQPHIILTFRTRLGYGLGHILNDICSSLVFSYLLLFMNSILKFKSRDSGMIMLIGQIADATANPIIGIISDKINNVSVLRCKKKTWHFTGTLLVAICFPLTFIKLNWSLSSYTLCYIMFQFGWAAVQNTHLSLMPELSASEQGRLKLGSIRYFFNILCNILVYLVSWYVMYKFDDDKKAELDYLSFRNIMLICYIIGILATLPFYILVEESRNIENESSDTKGSIFAIITNISYCQGAIVYMSTMLFTNMIQAFIPLYLHETFKMNGTSLVKIPLCIYLGNFATSFFVKNLSKVFRRLFLHFVGAFMGLGCCLWIYIRSNVVGFEFLEIYYLAVILGIATCILQVTTIDTITDLIASKADNRAFVFGFMTLNDKLSSGIAILVIESMHEHAVTNMFYGNAVVLVCSAAILVALPIMIVLSKRVTVNRLYSFIE